MKRLLLSPWILLPLALGYFFWQLGRWNFVVDDAYISYRYAQHLAEGRGLIFNPGEKPVEGYTNFLWTLLLSLAPRLRLSFETWSRFLGMVCTFFAAGFAARILALLLQDHSEADRPLDIRWSGVAVLLILTNASVILWSGAGMETTLFAMLLTGGVLFFLQFIRQPTCFHLSGAMLYFVLLSLCRPEGLALSGLFGLWVLLYPLGTGGCRWMRVAPLAVQGMVAGAHFSWRLFRYGSLLPNTYYAKVGYSRDQLWRGLDYLADYFGSFGSWLWLVFLFLAWRMLRSSPGRGFLFAAIGLWLAIVAMVGGDALPMYRFVVPVIPLLSVLLALGMGGFIAGLQQWRDRGMGNRSPFGLPESWILLLVMIAISVLPAYRGRQAEYVEADRERMEDRVEIGKWLRERYADKTIALNAAGAIPFYSGMRTIDMLGLNNYHIARRPVESLGQGVAGHEKHDVEYVLSRRPELIFIGRNELTLDPYGVFLWLEGDRKLVNHPRLRENYQVVCVPIGTEYFTFYLRKDIPLP